LNDTAPIHSPSARTVSAGPKRVTVRIPARLHFGFLDLNGGLGRQFGSIGLPISPLRTQLTIRSAPHMDIRGSEADRAGRYLDVMARSLDLRGPWALELEEAVPAHAGLGSGTQIALGVAAALRRLHGLPLDVRGDAIRLGRGGRSGVGIGLFEHGGLVVDGGRGAGPSAAPIISRLHFPEHWRILVVLDSRREGIHGQPERAAFAALPPFPAELAAHLCRLVVMKALPAVADADLGNFAAAIKEMQERLGDYFAPLQGGARFTSPAVAAALEAVELAGATGVGQSSWGPTGFAFAGSAAEAARLAEAARAQVRGRDLDIHICAGLNHGAEFFVHTDDAGNQ